MVQELSSLGFALHLGRKFSLENSIRRQQLIADQSGFSNIADEVEDEVNQPGFFEKLITTINTPQRLMMRALSDVNRPGDLLRIDESGQAGYETLFQGGSLALFDSSRMNPTRFFEEGSQGLIKKAIMDTFQVDMEPDPEESWRDWAIRKGADAVQIASEFALDAIMDPLLFPTMGFGKAGFITMKNAGKLTPGFRVLPWAVAERAGEKGFPMGVQVFGPKVYTRAVQQTASLFSKGVKPSVKAMVDFLPEGEIKTLLQYTMPDTVKSMRDRFMVFRRNFDKLAMVRQLPTPLFHQTRHLVNQLGGKKTANMGIAASMMKSIAVNLGPEATDALSTKKKIWMSLVADSGIVSLDKRAITDMGKAREFAEMLGLKSDDVAGLVDDIVRARAAMDTTGLVEIDRQLLTTVLEDYFPHTVKNQQLSKKIQEKITFMRRYLGKADGKDDLEALGPYLPFAQHRDFRGNLWQSLHITARELMEKKGIVGVSPRTYMTENIDEVIKNSLFELDFHKLLRGRLLASLNAQTTQDFYTTLTRIMGTKPTLHIAREMKANSIRTLISEPKNLNPSRVIWGGQQDLVPAKDYLKGQIFKEPLERLAKQTGVPVDQVYLPKALARELGTDFKWSKTFDSKMKSSLLGNMVDSHMAIWRMAVTKPNPAYYITNLIGDAERVWVGAGAGAMSPWQFKRVRQVLQGGDEMVQFGNMRMSAKMWLDELRDRGIMGSHAQRIGLEDIQALGEMESGVVGLASRAMRATGISYATEQTEATLRSMMYLALRGKGHNATHAASTTFDTLFDYYHGLTDFERKVVRRFIPFYSFLRFNAAFQAKAIINVPARSLTAAKLARTTQAGLDNTWRDLLLPFEEEYEHFGWTDKEGRPAQTMVRLTNREFWAKMPNNVRNMSAWKEAFTEWTQNFHPILAAGMRWANSRDPFYGTGPEREVLESRKFAALEQLPSVVQHMFGLKRVTTTLGEDTWQIDPLPLFLANVFFLGRAITTMGRLEEGGVLSYINETIRGGVDGLTTGGAIEGLEDHYGIKELTKFQAVVSAITGQAMIPFGEAQVLRREKQKLTREDQLLRRRLKPHRAAGELIIPAISMK